MALSMEQKLFYRDMINIIWQNSIGDNNVNNISEAVASDVDKVLYEIQNCSRAFNAVNAAFNAIYAITKPDSWVSHAVSPGISAFTASISDWIAALRGNAQYKACVVTAAVNWKSKIVLGLIGL